MQIRIVLQGVWEGGLVDGASVGGTDSALAVVAGSAAELQPAQS